MTDPSATKLDYVPPPNGPTVIIRRLLGATLAVPEVGVLIPLIAFTALFAVISPAILKPAEISSILQTISYVGLIAVGEAVLMISGELDLSVGSVAGLCGIVAGTIVVAPHKMDPAHPVQFWVFFLNHPGLLLCLALGAGLLAGALAGLFNGVVAVVVGVPAFITTLGMLYIARGINYLICHGNPVTEHVPKSLTGFGQAEPLGLSWPFFIFLATVLIADLAMRFTTFGRKIYATGGNSEVARVAGINTSAVKIFCYVLVGVLAAAGGMLTMANLGTAAPEVGVGWELTVIASVVIGGISLFGGRGTVAGAALGLITMQVVETGLPMTGRDPNWQNVAVGFIMIAAVAFDVVRRRAKTS